LDMRTSRGGCWHDGGRECQSSSRVQGRVDGRGSGRGFRVALARITP
jgi:formylglycine-generating enzyme required for sulfatase activity